MATGAKILIRNLCEEAMCPICLDYFKNPVTLQCGHNFCQICLAQCWKKAVAKDSCPECREKIQQRNLRPNRQLTNFVEITKKLRGLGEEANRRVCEMYQEPPKLFYKGVEVSICMICDRRNEPRNHEVIPVAQASQECEVSFSNQQNPQSTRRAMPGKLWSEQECLVMLQEIRRLKMQNILMYGKRKYYHQLTRALCAKSYPRKMSQVICKFKTLRNTFFDYMEAFDGSPLLYKFPPVFKIMKKIWKEAGQPSWEYRRIFRRRRRLCVY